MEKINACVIGSDNWSTALAKVVAENVLKLEDVENKVNMFVYDEIFEGRGLSDIINEQHINSKYLPHVLLPHNLIACNDLVESAKSADIIIFITPNKHIHDFCKTLLGKIKCHATAVSITKGFITSDSGGMELISRTITKYLKIPCAVFSGVNLPTEIVANRFCEATIGCKDAKLANALKGLFQTEYMRVTVVDDCVCVENIIVFGVGLLDGMDCNENIKSALIRFGLLEMMQFIDIFYPDCKLSTFFESCGISDLITICYGSRNRRIDEAFARTHHKIENLEAEMTKGHTILGPLATRAVNIMLTLKGVENKIFTKIYKICECAAVPSDIIHCILGVPDHIFHPINTVSM